MVYGKVSHHPNQHSFTKIDYLLESVKLNHLMICKFDKTKKSDLFLVHKLDFSASSSYSWYFYYSISNFRKRNAWVRSCFSNCFFVSFLRPRACSSYLSSLSMFSRCKSLWTCSFLSSESYEWESLLRPTEISFLSLERNFFKIIFFLESIPLKSFRDDFEVFVKFSLFLIFVLDWEFE